MKRISLLFTIVLVSFLVIKCSSGGNEGDGTKVTQKESDIPTVTVHEGFDEIGDLTLSLIESIKNNDYESYITHVMSRQEELAQSKLIENDSIREEFINEFSFSLHVEEDYFNNMVKYLNDSELNLERAIIQETIEIDYEDNKYAPCQLKEVIIPIEHNDMESDLVYVAIKIGDKWFLTAELGI